jgi:hypothetical protein
MRRAAAWVLAIISVVALMASVPLPAADVQKTAANTLAPSRATLQDKGIALTEALAQIEKQTGMRVFDRRGANNNPTLNLDLANVMFWQALDRIAAQANARLSFFEPDGQLALVKGPPSKAPVCYSGLFRVSLRRFVSVRDLDTDKHNLSASLEIAWEPRFHPLLLESKPQSFVVQGSDGKTLRNETAGSVLTAVEQPLATVIDLHLPALPPKADKISLLKGELSAIGPTKMLDFSFDNLAELATTPRNRIQEGIQVDVNKVTLDPERWTVQVTLRYPPGGPHFESYQSWVANNEMTLVNTVTGQRIPNNGNYNTEILTDTRAVINYHFVDERARKPFRGTKPEQWNVQYRTPAAIVQVQIPFEFKDVPLR